MHLQGSQTHFEHKVWCCFFVVCFLFGGGAEGDRGVVSPFFFFIFQDRLFAPLLFRTGQSCLSALDRQVWHFLMFHHFKLSKLDLSP